MAQPMQKDRRRAGSNYFELDADRKRNNSQYYGKPSQYGNNGDRRHVLGAPLDDGRAAAGRRRRRWARGQQAHGRRHAGRL
ncbi:hypothetical protein PINS_up023433 [Pythium insidiosum]|nr:hypothetical protein PINS_up023433 [Pythium insidiosum]